MNKRLRVLLVSKNTRGTYLNKILFELSQYFALDVDHIVVDASVNDLSKGYDLVVFDEVSIQKLKNLNLFYLRMLSRYTKFLYLTNLISEDIENKLYSASIDFIVRKNLSLGKVPPVLTHCINLILHQKNNFDILQIGKYEVNVISKTLKDSKKIHDLKSKEFLLLFFLFMNQEKFVSRKNIFENVWGFNDDDSSRLVDQTISAIRKITNQNFIISKYGVGYKLNLK